MNVKLLPERTTKLDLRIETITLTVCAIPQLDELTNGGTWTPGDSKS